MVQQFEIVIYAKEYKLAFLQCMRFVRTVLKAKALVTYSINFWLHLPFLILFY